VRFNEDADLDPSQVTDQRGMGTALPPGFGDIGPNEQVGSASLAERCRTGADANRDADCRAVAFINSIQSYWTNQLDGYRLAETNFFSGGVQTGCGNASSAVGPFVEAYVLAHEYGHHVQHLLGTSNQVGQATGPTSDSVRLELQADCYAGAWANHATTTPTASGEPLITQVTQEDVAAALDAAGRIGDDFIQRELGGGTVDTTQFSHGTSAQRQKWYMTGYQTGDPGQCATFDTNDLG
jgi:uncharacterized protein